MNKKMVRIVALILCGVLLLGMIPLIAFAEEVQPRGNVLRFETFEELKSLAEDSYSEWTVLEYNGTEEIVISEDLTLPENAQLHFWWGTLFIPENVTLAANELRGGNLIVEGTLECCYVEISSLLEVSGKLCCRGDINLYVYTQLVGLENIEIADEFSAIFIPRQADTMEELQTVLDEADATSNDKAYYCAYLGENTEEFTVTESLVIPGNVWIESACPVTVPAGVTVTMNEPAMWSMWSAAQRITVCGEMELWNLELYYDEGGRLEIAEGGTARIWTITVCSETESDMAVILPDIDLNAYSIDQILDGVWVLGYVQEGDDLGMPGDMDGDGLVDDADVAQLLWYTLFPDAYPIAGDADFDGDGSINDADVAYLLWHTLFPENYPL